MKKFLFFILSITLLSCSDGDFDIPAFDFEDNVSICGEYTLYRTNSDDTEAIALTMTTSDFTTTVGEEEFSVATSRAITYRVFDDGIGNNYFCQDIPPITPNVLKELTATNGTIIVTTILGIDDDPDAGYTYTITVKDLVFSDGDSQIVFETFNFGQITATTN